jgi:hypothetical protein
MKRRECTRLSRCRRIRSIEGAISLTVEQAELLRDSLFTVAEQNVGERNKILALHEQVMGSLSELKQSRD